jgi:hypothetical protein
MPMGYDNKVATVVGTRKSVVRNMKMEFMLAKSTFHRLPRTNTRNVRLGVDGSSVSGTIPDM